MSGVGSVEENDSVLARGGLFARNHADFSIGSRADVVDQSRVNLQRIEKFGVGGIADVIGPDFVADGRKIGVVADDPLFRDLVFFYLHAADYLDLAFGVARFDENRSDAFRFAVAGANQKCARLFGYESAIGIDAGFAAIHRPDKGGVRACGLSMHREVDDVARARFSGGRVDGQAAHLSVDYLYGNFGRCFFRSGNQYSFAVGDSKNGAG